MNQVILDEIRTYFFKLSKNNRTGFHISLYKAYEWLELDLTEDIKQKLLKRYLRSEDYAFIEAKSEEDANTHFIIRKDGKKHIPWFSSEGFKMLCLISKSVKSKYIIAHFIQCEKDYLRALKQTKEENEAELQILREKVNNFDSRLVKITNERDNLIVKNHFYRENNSRFKSIEYHTSTKEDFAMDGTPEHKLVCLMKKKFFYKTPIYLVNPDFVNDKYVLKSKRQRQYNKFEKKIKDELFDELVSPDEKDKILTESLEGEIDKFEPLQYEILYNEIFPGDLLQYSDMEFYFYIPSFKSKVEKKPEVYQFVGEIQVLNKEHLSYVKNYLNGEN